MKWWAILIVILVLVTSGADLVRFTYGEVDTVFGKHWALLYFAVNGVIVTAAFLRMGLARK